MQPLLGVVLSCHIRHEIKSRQSGLTTRRDKYQNRFVRRVSLDGSVRWLVHGSHSGAVVFAREAVNVYLQLYWPHSRMEVEHTTLHAHTLRGADMHHKERRGHLTYTSYSEWLGLDYYST